ncbi:TOMM precursor leader peptide-binding protein [Embleya sp. AB8]|uniref:TOMM precursor leader peptide-binding protein n=1 Tax=Embleya sp. AB8 TaxID=3156304 RepID=UPI003C73406C
MADSYPSVADCRPRVKHDVLFVQTPTGVLFHDARGGFQLSAKPAYRLACLIVPYLDGRRTVAQICAGLDEDRRDMVADLVSALLERGYARDAAPAEAAAGEPDCTPAEAERFAAQLGYIAHYVDGAEQRFARFRRTRVAVLGGDLVARWCALGLIRNGSAVVGVQDRIRRPENRFAEVTDEIRDLAAADCPAELVELPDTDRPSTWAQLAGFDVVVACVDALGPRRLLDLVEAGVPEGVALLPAVTIGERVLVGPFMSEERTGCWICAVLRLGANDAPGVAAQVWSRLAVPAAGPGTGPSRHLAAMLGNLMAYEVFRRLTGALPPETAGRVITQDLASMDVSTEVLAAHPACPVCRTDDAARTGPGAETDPLAGVQPLPAPVAEAADAEDASAVVDELAAVSALVAPTMGVFTRFDDDPLTQMPLKVGRVVLGLGDTCRRTVTAFDVHHTAGARLRAVYRAAEVYAEHVARTPGPAHRELPRIAPNRIDTDSGTGASPADVGTWVAATSLVSGERYAVPAGAVRGFGTDNLHRLFAATSAGTGAGRNAAEALDRGALGALAYCALTTAVAGAGTVGAVPPDELDEDPELRFLLRTAANLELDVELLHLAAPDPAVPVFLARTVEGAEETPLWAIGAHLSRRRAASDALRDLLGHAQLRRDRAHEGEVDPGDPLLPALDPYALAIDTEAKADLGAVAAWAPVLDGLRERGRDVLAIRTASADLRVAGITTVRVLLADRA